MRRRRLAMSLIIHVLLMATVVALNLPFLWMVLTSLKSPKEVFTNPPTWIPSGLRIENYVSAWKAVPFGRYFLNSIVTASAIAFAQTLLSALAAFAFAKMKFKGRSVIFYLFIGTMMIPGEVLLVPDYIIVKKLGWLDTYAALIVPFMASAFGVFLIRQFFLTIPRDLDDAAEIDGCSKLQYLFQILMPLSKPALLTVGLFAFISSWNSLVWPLVATNTDEMRVVMVGLSAFQDEFNTGWNELMAASTFVTVPVIVLFFFIQRQFIEGMTMAGLKG